MVSSATVIAAGTVRVSRPDVSAPAPARAPGHQRPAGSLKMASQYASSSSPSGSCACRLSCCAHPRNGVPTGPTPGSPPPRSASTPPPDPAPGCAKTPHRSPDGGFPRAAGPPARVNHTAWSITPAAGAAAPRPPIPPPAGAQRLTCNPERSIRRRQSTAATAPRGARTHGCSLSPPGQPQPQHVVRIEDGLQGPH